MAEKFLSLSAIGGRLDDLANDLDEAPGSAMEQEQVLMDVANELRALSEQVLFFAQRNNSPMQLKEDDYRG